MAWRQRLAWFAASARQVKHFCQAESVSQATFHRWRKQLAGVRPPAKAGFIEVGTMTAQAVTAGAPPPGKKTVVAGHERERKAKAAGDGADEASLFFDERRVPVDVIAAPSPEMELLTPDQYEVIGEKLTRRLAQRPGGHVVLKYVRPLIKRRDTQALSCPPAPVGVIDGSRADVSFVVGRVIDECDYHLPLYRQHRRLDDAGIRVSRRWLTRPIQSAAGLLEPIYDAQLDSVRASRVKAMDEVPIKAGRAGPGAAPSPRR